MLEAAINSNELRDSIVNWPDVADHIHSRLRIEIAYLGGDPILDAAAEQLTTKIQPSRDTDLLPEIVPTTYPAGNQKLPLF